MDLNPIATLTSKSPRSFVDFGVDESHQLPPPCFGEQGNSIGLGFLWKPLCKTLHGLEVALPNWSSDHMGTFY